MAQSNPNKANQHVPDPRQSLFLEYYLTRDSETFSDALQSGIKAGFTEKYSLALMSKMPTWLSETVRDEELIHMAESNLKEFLGKSEDDKKVKADMTKFTLKGLMKKKYSEKVEVEANIAVEIKGFDYVKPE